MVEMSTSNDDRASQGIQDVHLLMKKLKFLEKIRVKSFKNWQYDEGNNCSVKKMAEAGFYYSGLSEEDDSATCFVCGKVLDGWERDDEPWKEHDKHAPNCKFVKMRKSESELSVEEFFDLGAMLIKSHSTHILNKKLTAVKKRADEINNCLKIQQF